MPNLPTNAWAKAFSSSRETEGTPTLGVGARDLRPEIANAPSVRKLQAQKTLEPVLNTILGVSPVSALAQAASYAPEAEAGITDKMLRSFLNKTTASETSFPYAHSMLGARNRGALLSEMIGSGNPKLANILKEESFYKSTNPEKLINDQRYIFSDWKANPTEAIRNLPAAWRWESKGRKLYDPGVVHYDVSGGRAVPDIIKNSSLYLGEDLEDLDLLPSTLEKLYKRGQVRVGDLSYLNKDNAVYTPHDAWASSRPPSLNGKAMFYPNEHEGTVAGAYGAPGKIDINSILNEPELRRELNMSLAAPQRGRFNQNSEVFAEGGRVTTQDNGVIPALMARARQGLSDYGTQVAERARTLRDQPISTLNAIGQDVIRQLQTPEGALEVAMNQPMSPLAGLAGVIKNKGGNWLTGSVEGALKDLHYDGPISKQLNQWIDKPLTRYVKNEMATPEDPLRALAERGVLHYDPTAIRESRNLVHPSGEELNKLGQSEAAKGWENLSDRFVYPNLAGNISFPKTLAENPWLESVKVKNPATPIYSRGSLVNSEDLGFNHLIDELSNAINPESGLPRHLQFPADRLSKVSVPQAVERVDAINRWRAALKAEADQAKANNAATVLHKEYPENNPKGLKWVELKANDTLPEGHTLGNPSGYPNRFAVLDPSGQSVKGTIANSAEEAKSLFAKGPLSDALKYEGDTMGHCVGGYCDDVASGRSKIYSLRDAKGQPHTTIEVAPGEKRAFNLERDYERLTPEEQALADAHTSPLKYMYPDQAGIVTPERLQELYDTSTSPSRIIQIKGKGNLKPADEYQPFVQDFVKSGKWSDVGDLENTGLIDTSKLRKGFSLGIPNEQYSNIGKALEQAGYSGSLSNNLADVLGPEGSTHMTYDEILQAIKPKSEPGFAHGGPVTNKIETPEQLRAILSELNQNI